MFRSRLSCTTFAFVVYNIIESSQCYSVAQYGLPQDIAYNYIDWCILAVQRHRIMQSLGWVRSTLRSVWLDGPYCGLLIARRSVRSGGGTLLVATAG
jgi:hypothetical protein